MTVYFLETETAEQEYFDRELAGHECLFAETPADIPADAEVVSTFIYAKIDRDFLEAHPRLRLLTTRSSGVDHIDLSECARRQVTVAYVPSYGDNTVAEHTFALILALSRRLRPTLEAARKTHQSLESMRGFDLKGKTLGVVGTGRIGRNVIRMARGFEMDVVAFDIQPPAGPAEGFRFVTFDELLAAAHIITLHLPLTRQTHHLFNRETFAKCRRGVIMINTARGAIIDTAAFNEAMDQGVVGGAGLDVLEDERVLQEEQASIIGNQILTNVRASGSPQEFHRRNPERVQELQALMENNRLLARPNVVFTPHAAFNSVEAVERINRTTVENIRGFLEGKPVNLVPASLAG